jgi:hypothetical protein
MGYSFFARGDTARPPPATKPTSGPNTRRHHPSDCCYPHTVDGEGRGVAEDPRRPALDAGAAVNGLALVDDRRIGRERRMDGLHVARLDGAQERRDGDEDCSG